MPPPERNETFFPTIMLRSILAVRPDSESGGHVVSGQAAQTAAQWKSGPPDLLDHPPPLPHVVGGFQKRFHYRAAQLLVVRAPVCCLVVPPPRRHDKRQPSCGSPSLRSYSLPESHSHPPPGMEQPDLSRGAHGLGPRCSRPRPSGSESFSGDPEEKKIMGFQ